MEYKYQFFEKHKLLIQQGIGELSKIGHESYLDKVYTSQKMKSVKKVLSDMRFLKVKKGITEMPSLVETRSKYPELNFTNVFLVSNPSNTAAVHLYTDKQVSKGYSYSYCSTLKEVIQRLDLDFNESELADLLDNLENKFEV